MASVEQQKTNWLWVTHDLDSEDSDSFPGSESESDLFPTDDFHGLPIKTKTHGVPWALHRGPLEIHSVHGEDVHDYFHLLRHRQGWGSLVGW